MEATIGVVPLSWQEGANIIVGQSHFIKTVEDLAEIVISTVPGATEHGMAYPEPVRREAALLDVAYEPWPSELATAWDAVGGTVVSGLEMLLHQAIGQVRIFVTGDERGALPRELEVIAAMRASVGLSAHPARPAL